MKKEKYYALSFWTIQAMLVLAIFLSIHKGLMFATSTTIVFFFWNEYFYHRGSRAHCLDEWEEGLPSSGLKKMIKSWPFFLILALTTFLIVS